MQEKYALIDLEEEKKKGNKWIFGKFHNEESNYFSDEIEIGYVTANKYIKDQLHYHTHTQEYYVVMRGEMEIRVDEEILKVLSGQMVLIRPFTPHMIIQTSIDTGILLIKSPPGMNDKVIL